MADQSSLFGEDDIASTVKNHVTPGEPLAARMRPRTLDEIVGQEHLLGPGKALRRNMMRTALTMLGVIIGVSAVIVITSKSGQSPS